MEKDFARIKKNDNTEVVIRVDDFGGKVGLTIREFTNDPRTGYKGFTKAGTRIPAEKFLEFREAINSIPLEDLKPTQSNEASEAKAPVEKKAKAKDSSVEDY